MLRSLFLILSVLIAVPAYAQNSQPPMPAPLALQMARGAQVYYLGKFDLLDGWALIRTGQPEFYYATPGSEALVMGLLFNKKGDLLTVDQFKSLDMTEKGGVIDMMAERIKENAPEQPGAAPAPTPAPAMTAPHTPAPAPVNPAEKAPAVGDVLPFAVPEPTAQPQAADPSTQANTPANRLLSEIKGGSAILWGDAKRPSFYAFIDPNCSHCQDFLKLCEPLVKANVLSVYVFPIGFDTKSIVQAAYALEAQDGMQRMLDYAKGKTDALPVQTNLVSKKVDANVTILSNWNLMASPIIVYRAGDSQEVKIIRGRPLDMEGAVYDLVGLKGSQ